MSANPLLPSRTLKFMSKGYNIGAGTGILPWHLQPEVGAHPLVTRTGIGATWFLNLNLVYPYPFFAITVFLTFHGLVFQGWGQIEAMFSTLSLGLAFCPILSGSILVNGVDRVGAAARESLKHVQSLKNIMQHEAKTPSLVSHSHLAMELMVCMSYGNTASAALMTLLIPWLPLAASNFVELVVGITFSYPWKALAKVIDIAIIMYMGQQVVIVAIVLFSTLHCFSICNTAVLKDFMSKKPSLIQLGPTERGPVIVAICRRIELLSIGINESFSVLTFLMQTLIILLASTLTFAAIKFEGAFGLCLGVVGVFFVVINVGYMTYCSMLGERMAKLREQLAREFRSDALLRRQVRCMRPAYIKVGSFYHVDKECILTCCMVIVNNVMNALMMTRED